ncbi:hypothetical protein ACWGQ4_16830 [Streptomyces sp. NPDC055721]|uniref:hypothetical protein n=1 Tax=Streptomyces sp. NPDC127132 TaxID=3345374 RepID=UPI003633FB1E
MLAVSPPREPSFGAVTVEAARALVFPEGEAPTIGNALYQRLGYRPVTDHLGVEFTVLSDERRATSD